MNRCEICGEPFRDEEDPMAYLGSDERGEFVREELRTDWRGEQAIAVIHLEAHADCGLNAGLPLA